MSHYTAMAVGKSRKSITEILQRTILPCSHFYLVPIFTCPGERCQTPGRTSAGADKSCQKKKINKNHSGQHDNRITSTQIIPLQSPDQTEALWKWKREQMGMYWTSTKLQSRDPFCQGFPLKLQYNSNYISSCRTYQHWLLLLSKCDIKAILLRRYEYQF